MRKIKFIDLFAGCGGLFDGFMQSGKYKSLASVEWEFAPTETLKKRLKTKWNDKDADKSVIRFDIQRTKELLNGFDDPIYGKSEGLLKIINKRKVDVIIGGPPCQAYSVAGRVSVVQDDKPDYRNFLFEYYLKIVEAFKPDLFVFENVPGMLSAMPDGTPIIDLIKRDINKTGYEIIDDIRSFAIVNAADFNVPQVRKRVILVGLNKKVFKSDRQRILRHFYTDLLGKYKSKKIITVEDSIGDLPPCMPLWSNKRPSHTTPTTNISWQIPRFNNLRDVKIFELLAKDIETKQFNYVDSKKLIEMYNNVTGSSTNVHKYHVLRRDEPSTTILAHLYKDGLRFIHYDSKQARTITVREAARLQTFDDDFDFVGSMGDAFKMIGNAVPCKMALAISKAINDLLMEEK